MATIKFQEVDIALRGIVFTFSGKYYTGRPATMYDRHGDPGHPADPADFELDNITYQANNGVIVDVTEIWQSMDLIDMYKTEIMEALGEKLNNG